MAKKTKRVPALRVSQWQREWSTKVEFNDSDGRREPEHDFYIASIPAVELKRLADIHRRSAEPGQARALDQRSQRQHDPDRSSEIAEFVRYGYPWSTLSKKKRASGEFADLRKPGWLPTAIVVNVLGEEDSRQGVKVASNDLVTLDTSGAIPELCYPKSWTDSDWEPSGLAPIEVIDGQHRLWAFDDDSSEEYELPVVVFNTLDTSWQAYLFYTINIKPKKINTSLAFDLYPLLRNADWLQKAEEHPVYRETRAQELVEVLWSYEGSPWCGRINMLGERGRKGEVTQAAWIRSLVATFVKSFEGPGVRFGGLFGAAVGSSSSVLAWTRLQQAAVLVETWSSLEEAIEDSDAEWAELLRGEGDDEGERSSETGVDLAMSSPTSLLSTDQGVRGVLAVVNDLCVLMADDLNLSSWTVERVSEDISDADLDMAITDLRKTALGKFLRSITGRLAEWDWRTSAGPGVEGAEQRERARFRGGTGYKEIRLELLDHLASADDEAVAEAAAEVLDKFP